MADRRKTLASFSCILWHPIRTSFFPPGSKMESQGTTKWTKMNMFDKWKNLSKFLLYLVRSFQDFTFSTRIQGGIPRDNQRDQTGKCLTSRKTQASFYWIVWGPFRNSFFPPESRMGSQGTTKGTKKGKCLTGRKTLSFCCGILWGPSRTSLFPPGSRMGSQGTAKGTKKENAWQTEKP